VSGASEDFVPPAAQRRLVRPSRLPTVVPSIDCVLYGILSSALTSSSDAPGSPIIPPVSTPSGAALLPNSAARLLHQRLFLAPRWPCR